MANKPKRVRLPDNVRLVAPITWGGDCYFVELDARRAPAQRSGLFASTREAMAAWVAGEVVWEDPTELELQDDLSEEELREDLAAAREAWEEERSSPYQFSNEDFEKLFVPD